MGAAAIPVAALVLTGIGTGVAAYGQYQSGVAQRQQANYQSKVAKNNAIMADRAAEGARSRGSVEELQSRLRTKQAIGTQRARSASMGVQVDTGSALDLVGDISQAGEFDALNIRYATELEAGGYTDQARQFRSDAQLRRIGGQQQEQAGLIDAGSTFLTGGGNVADKWYQYKSKVQ